MTTNQNSMTGPKTRPMLAVPRLLHGEQREQDDQRRGHHVGLEARW